MIKQKILFCNNYIIDSKKEYSLSQLKLFYLMIYKFRECVHFKNDIKSKEEFSELSEVIKDELLTQIIEPEEVSNFFNSHITYYDIDDLFSKMEFPYSLTLINNKGNCIKKIFIFDYVKREEDFGSLYYKFNESSIEYINDIYENFSKIDLYDFVRLRSKYSQRMYELGCRYVNQKYYTMPIEVLKKYFNITKKYSNAEINREVLKKAMTEINNKTKINVNISLIKKGRNITHVKFEFLGGYNKK